MRNVKRIDRIVKLLAETWKRNPQLRLCQLIGNCYPAGDNYYREDDDLEQRLKDNYKEN